MADGFGAITFDVYIRQPWGNAKAQYEVLHIPYGDVNYVVNGGRQTREESLAIGLASEADYDSLEALVSTQATLTVNGTAHTDAVLVSLQRTRVIPVEAAAVFIVP